MQNQTQRPSSGAPWIAFQGTRYYRDKHGYYKARRDGGWLQRDVWSATYGNIPHGWVVHHKDKDRSSIIVEEMMAMPDPEHRALSHGPRLRRRSGVCPTCDTAFTSAHPAIYCSRACKVKASRRRNHG